MMPTTSKGCLPAAVKLLARRDHSEKELKQKLGRQGHSQEAIDAALAELCRRGYLDDAALARRLTVRYLEEGKYGRHGIRDRLRQRGFSAAAIAAALTEYPSANEYEKAAAVARTQYPAAVAGDAPRIGRFLAGRGFAAETILLVLEQLYRFHGRE